MGGESIESTGRADPTNRTREDAPRRRGQGDLRQLLRTVTAAVVALIVGSLLGVGVTTAAVGLLPLALGSTLVCSVNGDGTVTTCIDNNGQQVQVPHHIRIRQ